MKGESEGRREGLQRGRHPWSLLQREEGSESIEEVTHTRSPSLLPVSYSGLRFILIRKVWRVSKSLSDAQLLRDCCLFKAGKHPAASSPSQPLSPPSAPWCHGSCELLSAASQKQPASSEKRWKLDAERSPRGPPPRAAAWFCWRSTSCLPTRCLSNRVPIRLSF